MMSRQRGASKMIKIWLDDLAESAKNLKKTRVMVACAMLLAIEVVLNATASVYLFSYLRLSFGYLAVAAAAYLFGPSPAMLIAALSDIIVFLIRPSGPFFPGFTLNAALGGLVYGLAFYRAKEVNWTRILVSQAVIAVVLHIALNTLWLSLTLGKGFIALLPARALKNAIQYAIDVPLLYFLLQFLKRQFRKG